MLRVQPWESCGVSVDYFDGLERLGRCSAFGLPKTADYTRVPQARGFELVENLNEDFVWEIMGCLRVVDKQSKGCSMTTHADGSQLGSTVESKKLLSTCRFHVLLG